MAVARLTAVGAVDASFGSSGMALLPITGTHPGNLHAIQVASGKVVAAGVKQNGAARSAIMTRFDDVAGAIDWNTSKVFGQANAAFYGLVLDASNWPIAVGSSLP